MPRQGSLESLRLPVCIIPAHAHSQAHSSFLFYFALLNCTWLAAYTITQDGSTGCAARLALSITALWLGSRTTLLELKHQHIPLRQQCSKVEMLSTTLMCLQQHKPHKLCFGSRQRDLHGYPSSRRGCCPAAPVFRAGLLPNRGCCIRIWLHPFRATAQGCCAG